MLFQTTFLDLLINSIPFLVSFTLVVLLFGCFLYLSVLIWKIKDKSEDFDKNFLFRSFVVAFLAALIVIFTEFLFVIILLFSPIFKEGFSIDLMTSILNTNIWAIPIEVINSPIYVIVMFSIFIFIIVVFNSLVMLEAYKVHFGWTTVMTWTAIGFYLLIDLLLFLIGIEDGMAGVFGLIGDTLYSLLRG